jgi:hypothetical protein
MCKKSGETIDHLLLYCEVARDLSFVGFDLPSFWFGVGYASKGGGVVRLLERLVGKPL